MKRPRSGGKATGFARRRDANEPEVVAALEAVGATVDRLTGRGQPDLLVGFSPSRLPGYPTKGADFYESVLHAVARVGVNLLLEVKTPTGRLTADQERWFGAWRGRSVRVVTSPEEALACLGLVVRQPGLWTHCAVGDSCPGESCPAAASHLVGTYPMRVRPKTIPPRRGKQET